MIIYGIFRLRWEKKNWFNIKTDIKYTKTTTQANMILLKTLYINSNKEKSLIIKYNLLLCQFYNISATLNKK